MNSQISLDFFIDKVKPYYSQAHRAYHNINHVGQMFKFFFELYGENPKPHEMFAIVYHDAIYDPWNFDKGGNEEASADLLRIHHAMWYSSFIAEETIELACEIILSTTHTGNLIHESARRVVDSDLAILGQSRNVYCDFANAIRKEYCLVSDSVYINGRENALIKFLERDMLYHTPEARNKYETLARSNIQFELAHLKQSNTFVEL